MKQTKNNTMLFEHIEEIKSFALSSGVLFKGVYLIKKCEFQIDMCSCCFDNHDAVPKVLPKVLEAIEPQTALGEAPEDEWLKCDGCNNHLQEKKVIQSIDYLEGAIIDGSYEMLDAVPLIKFCEDCCENNNIKSILENAVMNFSEDIEATQVDIADS